MDSELLKVKMLGPESDTEKTCSQRGGCPLGTGNGELGTGRRTGQSLPGQDVSASLALPRPTSRWVSRTFSHLASEAGCAGPGLSATRCSEADKSQNLSATSLGTKVTDAPTLLAGDGRLSWEGGTLRGHPFSPPTSNSGQPKLLRNPDPQHRQLW